MTTLTLLQRLDSESLTPEEELTVVKELAAAYHMDESAATSRDVQRIAEKVRVRMAEAEIAQNLPEMSEII